MKLLIIAYENCFCGEHNMNMAWVGDYDSIPQAEDDAIAASYEVMEKFNSIQDILNEDCEKYLTDNLHFWNKDDWEDAYEYIISENVAYDMWEIEDKNLSDKTAKEINELYNKIGTENFLERYKCCKL